MKDTYDNDNYITGRDDFVVGNVNINYNGCYKKTITITGCGGGPSGN